MEELPELLFDSILRDRGKTILAVYEPTGRRMKGSYGCLKQCWRKSVDGARDLVMIKTPRFSTTPHDTFYKEALLQQFLYKALLKRGVQGIIPRVYDIFRCGDDSAFSMEYIDGVDALTFCLRHETPETVWFSLLFQVAMILQRFREEFHFEHRDCKWTNLWVRTVPVEYTWAGYTYKAPFQVVFLDLGLACLGDGDRNALLNLGDGYYHAKDACPKEGRDMYQLLSSFWSSPSFRSICSQTTKEWIVQALSPNVASILEKTGSYDLSYVLGREEEFVRAGLEPAPMLETICRLSPISVAEPSLQSGGRT